MIEQIKKIIFNFYMYSMLLLFTLGIWIIYPLLLFFIALFTRRDTKRFTQRYVRYYGWALIKLIPFWSPVIVEDKKNESIDGPVIYVSNHCSSVDPFLFGALPGNMVFLTSWPFKMPLFNIIMRKNGYIDSRKGWETLKKNGAQELSSGTSIIIWPESHRSKDGMMKRFYSGAFHLSQYTGRPVAPVAVFGTHKLLPPKHRLLTPSKVRMVLLPPVWPKEFQGNDSVLKMKKYVKSRLAEALGQEY